MKGDIYPLVLLNFYCITGVVNISSKIIKTIFFYVMLQILFKLMFILLHINKFPISDSLVYILVTIVLYIKFCDDKHFNFTFDKKYIIPTCLLLFGMIIVCDILSELSLYMFPIKSSFYKDIFENIGNEKPLKLFFEVVIIGPIFEEIVFRKIILKELLNKHTKNIAIVISALIFSLIHLNIWQFFTAFPIGIILGLMFYETDSVFLCIIFHSLYNLSIFLNFDIHKTNNIDYIICFMIGIFITVLGLKLIKSKS